MIECPSLITANLQITLDKPTHLAYNTPHRVVKTYYGNEGSAMTQVKTMQMNMAMMCGMMMDMCRMFVCNQFHQ